MKSFPQKWRPSLSMIVIAMLLFVLCLPLGGIWLFRFYDRHLVRQTESELIVQGAFIKSFIVSKLKETDFDASSLAKVAIPRKQSDFDIILPVLDLSSSPILPARGEAQSTEIRPLPVFSQLGEDIKDTLLEAQKTTLAGYRILDPDGIVIMGRAETGKSLNHIPEVKSALQGKYASAIRKRISDSPTPPIYSISRGTGIRVFVAMPVEYEGKITGVVYLSRTPSHFLRELYGQRWNIAIALIFILVITLVIATIFIRTVKGPIDALNARTDRIAKGDRSALEPLDHHGTREIASLSQGLLSMSEKLQDRSDYIRTFASHVSHELKSPLTSIRGAAELMSDASTEMTVEARQKFLCNIIADTERLTKLLDRLRDLAAAESLTIEGECILGEVFNGLQSQISGVEIFVPQKEQKIPIPMESARIVFSNLMQNSKQHGATTVSVDATETDETVTIVVSDNGNGISDANREKMFELFFTTKRENGGTGMGLGIVQSVLSSCDGTVRLLPSEKGASFELTFRKHNATNSIPI